MLAMLKAPELVSSRRQSRELTRSLADDLSGTDVDVDCSALKAASPSFIDELVRITLLERNARRLRLLDATPRVQRLLREIAANYGVTDRLAA